MIRLKITAAFCAALIAVTCTACSNSGSDKNNSSKKASSNKTDSSYTNDSSADKESSPNSKDSALDNNNDTLLGRFCDFLSGESYSFRMKYTDFDGKVTDVYRVCDGNDFYQLQTNDIGESGSIRVGEECYDFDLVCGIYRKSSNEKLDSIIESILDEDLPQTATHIDEEDAQLYNVEEYTYTGDTYITIMDFCFDKSTGALVKYTSTYSVEGDDDITETREFYDFIPAFEPAEDSFSVTDSGMDSSADIQDSSQSGSQDSSFMPETGNSEGIDRSIFDASFINTLVDFNNMTEERRLGYCQAIFVTAGVTAEELAQAEITDEKLKTVSYEEFTSLVYLYGYN